MSFIKIVFHVNFLNDDLAVFTQKKKPESGFLFSSLIPLPGHPSRNLALRQALSL